MSRLKEYFLPLELELTLNREEQIALDWCKIHNKSYIRVEQGINKKQEFGLFITYTNPISKYRVSTFPHPSGGYIWQITNRYTKEVQVGSYGRGTFDTPAQARKDALAEIQSWG